jgi:hypothetical protein
LYGISFFQDGALNSCSLVRAKRNTVGHSVFILYFYFFIELQFRAGQLVNSPTAQSLACCVQALWALY